MNNINHHLLKKIIMGILNFNQNQSQNKRIKFLIKSLLRKILKKKKEKILILKIININF